MFDLTLTAHLSFDWHTSSARSHVWPVAAEKAHSTDPRGLTLNYSYIPTAFAVSFGHHDLITSTGRRWSLLSLGSQSSGLSPTAVSDTRTQI